MSTAYERAEVRVIERSKASAGVDPNEEARSITVETSPATMLRRHAAGLLEADEVEAWLKGVQRTANWLGNVVLAMLAEGDLLVEFDQADPPDVVVAVFHTLATTIGQENVGGLLWAEELAKPGPGEVVRQPAGGCRVSPAEGPCEACGGPIRPGQLHKPGPLHLGCHERPVHGGYPEGGGS